jgi:hypothetical protein
MALAPGLGKRGEGRACSLSYFPCLWSDPYMLRWHCPLAWRMREKAGFFSLSYFSCLWSDLYLLTWQSPLAWKKREKARSFLYPTSLSMI